MHCPRSIRVESQLRARPWVRSIGVVQHMPRLRIREKLLWFALPLVHRIEHDGHGGFQVQPWHAFPRRDNALVILRRLYQRREQRIAFRNHSPVFGEKPLSPDVERMNALSKQWQRPSDTGL